MLLAAQSRKKYYVNHKVRDMSFKISEQVLVKVSLMNGVMNFGMNIKLYPRYISLSKVFDYVGLVA